MSNLWRPPTSSDERLLRAVRSMQNGTIDGRIATAYPIGSEGSNQEIEDDDDLTGPADPDAPDTVKLLPWTDYYRLDGSAPAHSFRLSRRPWSNLEMPKNRDGEPIKASMHVYWNGILQRDLEYLQVNRLFAIQDPKRQFRTNDVITVKYFYASGGGGGGGDSDPDPNEDSREYDMVIPLNSWLSNYTTYDRPFGYFIVYAGALSAPSTGVNSGTIRFHGKYYTEMISLAGYTMSFGLDTGAAKIPDAESYTILWKSRDMSCDLRINAAGINEKGSAIGARFCLDQCCFIYKPCDNDCVNRPYVMSSVSQGSGRGDVGQQYGSRIIATGTQAKQIVALVNSGRGVPVVRRVSDSVRAPTCSNVDPNTGSAIWDSIPLNVLDDTVWGKNGTWDYTVGNIQQTVTVIAHRVKD